MVAAAAGRPASRPGAIVGRQLPLVFERNAGQSDPAVRFLAHGASSTLFIGAEQAILAVAGARPGHDALKSARRAASVGSSLRIRYLGANGNANVEGRQALSARVNYFIGRDPRRWRIGIPTWRSVIARNVWRGIDLFYNGNRGNLECDFELAPGADASAIRLGLEGAERVHITHGGDLTMLVGGREVTFLRPRAFARAAGTETDVQAGFVIHPQASGRDRVSVKPVEVGFEVARYDRRAPLVIDPTLVYSSYLGGSGKPNASSLITGTGDAVNAITLDASGNEYITGVTTSPDFPVRDALQATCGTTHGCWTAFVAKLDHSTGAITYATFLGGSGGGNVGSGDSGNGIAVDAAGEAFVAGFTYSVDFPTTPGSFRTVCPGASPIVGCPEPSAFVASLTADGSGLRYSTLIIGKNGSSSAAAIAIDKSGLAYVTGQEDGSFPQTANGSFSKTLVSGIFVSVVNRSGSKLKYSAVLRSIRGQGNSIAVAEGKIYVGGWTGDARFPTTGEAYLPRCSVCQLYSGGFITILDPAAPTAKKSLIYSTYLYGLSTSDDSVQSIAVDRRKRIWTVGTTSAFDFPTTKKAFQTEKNCSSDSACTSAFLSILDRSFTARRGLFYSTFLSGSGSDTANSLAIDSSGRAYIAGQTSSIDFPVTPNAAQATFTPCTECAKGSAAAFVTVLEPGAKDEPQLIYSTYLGGVPTPPPQPTLPSNSFPYADSAHAIALDSAGLVHVAGVTFSAAFPVTANASQSQCDACATGGADGFVAKLDPALSGATLQYATFVGGSGPRLLGDIANAVALGPSGNIYVAGLTGSTDFPVSAQALERSCLGCASAGGYPGEAGGYDGFVSEINPAAPPDNQLIYSTYLGGTGQDAINAMALDSAGNAYVAGYADSPDFPITANGFSGAMAFSSAFFAKLDPTGSSLLYSTFLNGQQSISSAIAIAINSQGDAVLTGSTGSSDFPVTSNAFQQSCPACPRALLDGFVAEINPSASGAASLVYSTYLGGSGGRGPTGLAGDQPAGLALDGAGNAVVTGTTTSTDFPITSNSFESVCPSTPSIALACDTGFVSVIAPGAAVSSQLVYSSYLGGEYSDAPTGLALDGNGNIYVAGETTSPNLATTANALQPQCMTLGDCDSGFVAELDRSAAPSAQLSFATYLGGSSSGDTPAAISVDAGGLVYVAGYAASGDFPITPNALQATCPTCMVGNQVVGANAYLTVLDPSAAGPSGLVYSTLLGSASAIETVKAMAVDSSGHVVLAGSTSGDFPLTSNALQRQCLACRNFGDLFAGGLLPGNAFIAELLFDTP